MTGRKVELDEVVEPSIGFEIRAAPEEVLVAPTPIREEANDVDHETSLKLLRNFAGQRELVPLLIGMIPL